MSTQVTTVSFPGLGIGPFEVDPVAFTLPFGDGIPIMWYALIITTGFVVAFFYAWYRARGTKGAVVLDDLLDLMIVIILCGVSGARLYYVAMSPSNFKDILDVINIRTGGLAIYGGLIGGILGIMGVCLVKKKNILQVLDIIAPGVMLAQAIGRWGNFMNAEAHGGVVSESSPFYFLRMGLLPNENSMTTTYYYHPTFLYESLWNVAGFVLINLFFHKKRYHGQILGWYVTWYGLGRMWIEGLRTDSLMLGGFRVSQLLAIVTAVVGLVILIGMFIYEKIGAHTPFYEKLFGTVAVSPSSEMTQQSADVQPESAENPARSKENDPNEDHAEERNEHHGRTD